MSTYAELLNQAKLLDKQIQEARNAELASVIAEIREKMAAYGLTPADLESKKFVRKVGASKALVIKYRNEQGLTWSGGAGRKPDWVKDVMGRGGDIEQYRIPDQDNAASTSSQEQPLL